jgi:hypothetical protein
VADIVIDYELIHKLAGNIRTLRSSIETETTSVTPRTVLGTNGKISSEDIGLSTASYSVTAFYQACFFPFTQSLDRLNTLADILDRVAKTWFDNDASFAGSVSQQALNTKLQEWASQKKAYEAYLKLKDATISYQYYDENGNLKTATIALWDPSNTAPKDPGAAPTNADQTTAKVDDQGRITEETTTITGPDGLTYTETTTYTYNGDTVDYTTTVTHADGTTETIVKKTNSDGSYVLTDTTSEGTATTTVTPGTGGAYSSTTVDAQGDTTTVDVVINSDGTATKTVVGPKGTDVYTGSPDVGLWTLKTHTDPPADTPSDPN